VRGIPAAQWHVWVPRGGEQGLRPSLGNGSNLDDDPLATGVSVSGSPYVRPEHASSRFAHITVLHCHCSCCPRLPRRPKHRSYLSTALITILLSMGILPKKLFSGLFDRGSAFGGGPGGKSHRAGFGGPARATAGGQRPPGPQTSSHLAFLPGFGRPPRADALAQRPTPSVRHRASTLGRRRRSAMVEAPRGDLLGVSLAQFDHRPGL